MYRMSEMLGNKINDFKLYVDCIFKYVSLYPHIRVQVISCVWEPDITGQSL